MLVLPWFTSPELGESRPFLLSVLMCKYNSISSGSRRAADVSLVSASARPQPGFQSHCRSVFFQPTKPVSTINASRLLHQAPGLPRVELVVGCLQHLFYVTYQVCA